MRPLDKGPCPQDTNGNDITVNDYDKWRALLIDRIGYYCAYCNQPLSHSLQIEHVVPKDPPAGYTAGDPLAWSNMLLACGPCNRTKWNTPIDFNVYYFPEESNTALIFKTSISPGNLNAAIKIVNPTLSVDQKIKAQNTLDLLGLDAIDSRGDVVDIRWKKRRDAIKVVDAAYSLYIAAKQGNPQNIARHAYNTAIQAMPCGFFEIWYEKFKDEPEVMKELVELIPGTARDCFDANNGHLRIPRNPQNARDDI